MKIELKNLRVNLAFSEETTMFHADIYVDGIKAGHAQNDGRGGSTYYHGINRDLIEKAEAYCSTLPSTFYGKLEIKSDLEGVIDNLVEDSIQAKEKAKHDKKFLKDMEAGLLYGTKEKYTRLSWGLPIKAMLMSPTYTKLVLDKFKELKKAGHTILNTNLPNKFGE